MLDAPSSKFHCQDVGPPVDVSANCTYWPVTGEPGLNVKDEVRTDIVVTVMAWLPCLDPELVLAVNVTTNVPALGKAWLGFFAVLVDPSPKPHCQEVGLPEVVSAN